MENTGLYLEIGAAATAEPGPRAWPEEDGAAPDGVVVPASADPDAVPAAVGTCVVLCGPDEDATRFAGCGAHTRAAITGLEACARQRERRPGAAWVARAEVYRPAARFDFRPADHGEGFKTYVPDLATYRSHHVAGENEDLRDWLRRAAALGVDAVWLHGLDAAAAGRGLDLDMLARARDAFRGVIWISGGASEPVHLANLAAEGGAQAVVVPQAVARAHGVAALSAALKPPLPVTLAAAPAGGARA